MGLRINGSTSGYVELAAPAVAGSTSLTLPLNGFGKVLQVVQGTTADDAPILSTTYTDTNLSASITPSSTSSKILVLAIQHIYVYRASASGIWAKYKLMRNATDIWLADGAAFGLSAGVNGSSYIDVGATVPIIYLDSPATTSSITYKTQGAVNTTANGGQVIFQNGNDKTSTMVLVEVGP